MTPFNVRIYGLLVHENRLLIIREPFAGMIIDKFPGGGLEFGEGTIDCLKREFKEELNLEIEVLEHIYTQDFFLASHFDEKEQILMIYYKVTAKDIAQLEILDSDIQALIWKDLNEVTTNDLSLPTDKLVLEMVLGI
ncbi:MAG: NUDIX domain-containing protein [Flavobacteriaceae bacterium]|jgi:ADP-ribose pyrophosphatase YjhB (NUDIX family)|nr:NUDIX domain-containing protein [Flavobacteriaceae bacterium]